MRGLKQGIGRATRSIQGVAPYVGAWIETPAAWQDRLADPVAPYVGAWIETKQRALVFSTSSVAPYMGAWIETRPTY